MSRVSRLVSRVSRVLGSAESAGCVSRVSRESRISSIYKFGETTTSKVRLVRRYKKVKLHDCKYLTWYLYERTASSHRPKKRKLRCVHR